jgi:OOP family OmpA-OmpF porin
MEFMMNKVFTGLFRAAFAAIVSLGMLAGCADVPRESQRNGPELAGAWYQIYFDTDGVAISDRGQMIVDTVANIVANVEENGITQVTVIGRTDRVGPTANNMKLSMARAEKVRDALITAGVSAQRIDTTWTGEATQALATANDVPEQRNRVVDITVLQVPQVSTNETAN